MPFSTPMLDEHSSGDGPEPYGARLRALREHKGLSVEEASEATNIPPDKIEAIEAGRPMGDTPIAYARGFVRIYAEFLEADVEATLDAFDMQRRPEEAKLYIRGLGPMTHKDYRPGRRRGRPTAPRTVILIIAIAVIVLGAAYVYVNLDKFLGLREEQPSAGSGEDTGGSGQPAGGTGQTPAPGAGQYALQIFAKENVTIRVEQNGTLVEADEVVPKGQPYTASGKDSVKIRISDASRIEKVLRNGEPVTDDLGTGPVTLEYDAGGFRIVPEDAE
jgi:cytoskeleton protein RodZ